MTEPDSGIAQSAIHEIVESQMRDGTPPETRRMYDRLIAVGHSHDDAVNVIGSAISSEILGVLKQNLPYNQQRYVAALHALPKLAWDGDED